MQVGTLVKYNVKFANKVTTLGAKSMIGFVIAMQDQGAKVLWNNGTRRWDRKDTLEVLCE